MIINFNITRENEQGEVEYFNSRGQVVKTYPIQKLNIYVSGWIDIDSISDYIDNNWLSVTQAFYNAMNPASFQSNNKPQQNRLV